MRPIHLLVPFAIVISASLVCDEAAAKKKKKKKKVASTSTSSTAPKKKKIETGDPLPSKATTDPACLDAGAQRWLASDPITPFVNVRRKTPSVTGSIKNAGVACCAPWARKGSRWLSVDAYGQLAGEVEVDGGEGYDVSQCYELSMGLRAGKMGAGIFVGKETGFSPPKSVQWNPSEVERASLAKTVADLEKAMVPSASWSCPKEQPQPIASRTLFFTAPKTMEDASGKTGRWAVVGGPLLIVAMLDKDGRFIGRHVESAGANVCSPRAYRPLAAFDMDGDGRPEIVFHRDLGDSVDDAVLALEPAGFDDKWREIASSVGGSTA